MLYDRKLLIKTYHANLKYLYNTKSGRLQKWKTLLNEYDFTIEYTKGRGNNSADYLSRINNINFPDDYPLYFNVLKQFQGNNLAKINDRNDLNLNTFVNIKIYC